jgi:hypothetical protein
LAVAYARRAYVYRAKGNDDRAISDIQQASKLDSQFASAASEVMRLAQAIKEEQEKIEREKLRARDRDEVAACLRAHAPISLLAISPPQGWYYVRRRNAMIRRPHLLSGGLSIALC